MLFNSITFILFFIVVLTLYHLPFKWTHKKALLLLSSYLFYSAWNPPFVLLLFFSTFVDWHVAKKIQKSTVKKQRKRWLYLSLSINLGLLVLFKYSDFLLDNFRTTLLLFGYDIDFVDPGFILPMGISFYTFQTLSYTIDIYNKKIKPASSFLDYCLFVSFFPQLVAGPIVRAIDFLPQLKDKKIFNFKYFSIGIALIILGLFQKTVLADTLFANVVDEVFNSKLQPDLLSSWLAGWFFYGQIFSDFAGYSLCAIGCALCLGFTLPVNFNSPFAAIGLVDFWRRWHISLSQWLRDYLYIPLGGNKFGKLMTFRNLFITMFLGGLWHGAAWTFVLWGIMHGSYLIIERIIKNTIPNDSSFFKSGFFTLIKMLITMLFVMLAFVMFRAENLQHAMIIYSGMLNFGGTHHATITWNLWTQVVTLCFVVLTLLQWYYKDRAIIDILQNLSVLSKSLLLSLCLFFIITLSKSSDAFIYFQF